MIPGILSLIFCHEKNILTAQLIAQFLSQLRTLLIYRRHFVHIANADIIGLIEKHQKLCGNQK
jgi:hypothetical protein